MNFGMGCTDGKLYIGDLNAAVLAAVKMEVGKILGNRRKRKQKMPVSLGKDTLMPELKRLNAQVVMLDRRSISLYDDFAEGKIDREGYLIAKEACTSELAQANKRVEELTVQIDSSMNNRKIPNDEPFLHRILSATEITEEILILVERITVYDVERIEISFNFSDVNV